jgi:HAD superfamily hydrolase (TIGR01509 family)
MTKDRAGKANSPPHPGKAKFFPPCAPGHSAYFGCVKNLPAAVIFDWDGVVIDSSAQHERSWELLAAEENLFLPADHFKKGFGKKNQVIIPALGWATDPVEVQRLSDRKEELYRELVRRDGIQPLPGVRELLRALGEAGIPRSVGSSTPRANIEMIGEVADLRGFFEAVTCAEDVSHGKPDPEVFLLAAAKVGAAPADCVVIEDAHVGIEAGRRAGMKVVAVATTNPLAELGAADLAVQSLAELTPADLSKLFA